MSETDSSHSQTAAKPKTLIGKIISLPFTVFGILCGSLFLSIIVECLGIYWVWPEEGWHHAEQTFYSELEQLSVGFTKSIVLSDPIQASHTFVQHAYDWVFVKSGLLDQTHAVLTPQATDSHRKLTFRQHLNAIVSSLQTYLLAAGYTTLTFFVRLVVLLLCMPLIAMAVFAGFVDGLVKRDIRRFVAEHESGFVYHRARSFLIPVLTLPWVIYLALPVSISPLLVMIPCAVLASVVMNITVASFKKYL